MSPHIAFLCDTGPAVGVGHVMRCIALAEELRFRSVEPVFFCESKTVPWLAHQLAAREFVSASLAEGLDRAGSVSSSFDAVVFDSYTFPNAVYRTIRATGVPTMALIDGDLRGAEADLLLDQNLGAEQEEPALPKGSTRLAGAQFALIRSDVFALRPPCPPVARCVDTPNVLAVFGGTDSFGTGPAALAALAATGKAFDATVITPREELRRQIAKVSLSAGQHVTTVSPVDRIERTIVDSDLVIGAAGSSTWELLALGACAALLCVADNQEPGYRQLVESGAITGLGTLTELRQSTATASQQLAALLEHHSAREHQANVAWNSVDGLGRQRVADALLSLLR